ncbi:MAG: NAD(P)H-hydrate dehydratase [Desulfovermiculus sp.]|nr:NAD(P)H-hydrate dehydratase [Desulfovermiculus sp.]
MLAVVGTIPEDDFPLLCGRAEISPSGLRVEGKDIDVNRGTPALLAAACLMLQTLGREPPLAFLADEKAPHPFYTRGFILSEENKVPSLITRAYAHANAARYLLVKGRIDYVADSSGVLATVDAPADEAMEAVGGTGDTLTGVVSSLIESGLEVPRAAELAARINRTAGAMSHPTPASQIMDIIPCLLEAYELIKTP